MGRFAGNPFKAEILHLFMDRSCKFSTFLSFSTKSELKVPMLRSSKMISYN